MPEIDFLEEAEVSANSPQPAAQPAFASLSAEERLRHIQADHARTAETVRDIEAGINRAPPIPGDVFSLNRRLDRTLTEYQWLRNKGPAMPDFYFTSAQEAAENVRAVARALVAAAEAL
jgi:hypothetical protein